MSVILKTELSEDQANCLSKLKPLITDPKNQTIGAIFAFVESRKKKDRLRLFPDLLAALNNSGLVKRIFLNPEYKGAIKDISDNYRNVASHSGWKRLDIKDAVILRSIVYSNRLFPELVLARIDEPIIIKNGS